MLPCCFNQDSNNGCLVSPVLFDVHDVGCKGLVKTATDSSSHPNGTQLSKHLTKAKNNYIQSSKRTLRAVWDVKLTNNDGSAYGLEKRTYIKYMGVLIDDTLSWKHQVSYLHVCTRISRNTGIIGKLRYSSSLSQLKQLYYNLIYPYISYAITSWGSACTTQIKKVQTKQNHVIRLVLCPPCMDQIQTVNYYYLICWIYLLLIISIN